MSPNRPENDETLEALAHRLRRLPPPPVPSGLEERLLAAVPWRRRARSRSLLASSVGFIGGGGVSASRSAPAAPMGSSLPWLRSPRLFEWSLIAR